MTKVPASWRKSSFSAQDSDCVEVASTLDAVRDSKNGAVLAVDVRHLVHSLQDSAVSTVG